MHTRDRHILLAWLALPPLELWFAWQGFVRPEPWQIGFEVFGCLVLALCQIRFLERPWLRSPAWPGVLAISLTLLVLGPEGVLNKLVALVGLAVMASAAVYALESRWRVGLVGGLALTFVGAVGARHAVLERGADAGVNLQGAVANATRRVLEELIPLPTGRGTGSDGPPIVVISLDTLRWDHMVQMRSYKRLAARGVSWDRAMSTSSWTLPAMASLQTGMGPAEHGATSKTGGGFQGMRDDVVTLAQELSQAGYTTGAVLSNAWLEEELGFARGFHSFVHTNTRFPHRLLLAGFPTAPPQFFGENVADRALEWIGGAPARGSYLWLHFVDPHLPYHASEPGTLADKVQNEMLREMILTEEQRDEIRAAYAGQVEYLDVQLERVLDALDARGFLDDGVVIMTADHGEELWDHGGAEHGHSHHHEVVDVGMVIVAPDLQPGPGQGVVSLVDVAPTVRAVAGLEGAGIDLRGPIPADRVAAAFGNTTLRYDRSVRQGDLKVIVEGEPSRGHVRAYDLAVDPLERSPIALPPDHPLVRAALSIPAPDQRDAADINTDALRALGYVGD